MTMLSFDLTERTPYRPPQADLLPLFPEQPLMGASLEPGADDFGWGTNDHY